MPTEIPRETLPVADRNEILRKLTPAIGRRLEHINKEFTTNPAFSDIQVFRRVLIANMMAQSCLDPDIVEAVVRNYVRSSRKADHYMHGSYERFALNGVTYMIGVAYHGRWFIKKLEQGVPDGDIEPFLSTDNRLHLPDLVAEAWQV